MANELDEAVRNYLYLTAKLSETKKLHKAASERLKGLMQSSGIKSAESQTGVVRIYQTRTLTLKDRKQGRLLHEELIQKGYPSPFNQYNRYDMYHIAERVFRDNHGEIPSWLSYYIDFEKDRLQLRAFSANGTAVTQAEEDEE